MNDNMNNNYNGMNPNPNQGTMPNNVPPVNNGFNPNPGYVQPQQPAPVPVVDPTISEFANTPNVAPTPGPMPGPTPGPMPNNGMNQYNNFYNQGQNMQMPTNNVPEKSPKKNTIKFIIIGLVALLVVVVIIVAVTSKGSSNESNNNNNNNNVNNNSNEKVPDENDSIKTYTSKTIVNFTDDANDGELVKIKDLKVKDGRAQYPNDFSSYIVDCDNEISLTEGSTVTIVGNVRGYGIENLNIIVGLSNCEVK